MSNEEHLYENIITLVQKYGAYHFTKKDAQKIKDEGMVSCAEYASVEAIGHLIGMANYVVYLETIWGVTEVAPFSEQAFGKDIIHCGIK